MHGRAEKRARRDAYVAACKEATGRLEAGDPGEALQLLDSPWSGVRSMAVRELRKADRTREVLPELIEHARHERDDSVQLAIALALRDLEDPGASDTLWALFEVGSEGVRFAALRGLSRLGDDRVIPIALSWYHSGNRFSRPIGVFDLVLMQSSNGEAAVADLLASETSWRRRRLIRRAIRRAERWLARHG